jgi:hydroxymethylpyrimidine pyrophosphatase-like HAD family hydrolase
MLAGLKIPKSRIAGIGDTYGDRFIADAVSFFACPSNADSEIRSRADYISLSPEIDGVLDILNKLV